MLKGTSSLVLRAGLRQGPLCQVRKSGGVLSRASWIGRQSTGQRAFHASAFSRSEGGAPQHRDTPDNNENTPFEFTEENYQKAKAIMAKYPPNYKKSAISPLLDLAQRQHGGWLPLAAMHKVATILGVSNMEVYEVATFYTMFNKTKVGKYHLQLCTTTPCMLGGCGSTKILETIKSHLKIEPGETTNDGLFTLTEVECLGACVNAPMLQIGDYYYEDLTPETTIAMLEKLKNGEMPKPGPQNGRNASEGPLGRTSLKNMKPEDLDARKYCKNLD
ncbi:Ndufv2NADH dehydrogenase flavoprotein subunit 2 [Balamuthia mandrillaris]